MSAQRICNVVAGDPPGKSNARFTFSNFLALLPVWLIWGSVLVGMLPEQAKLHAAP